VPAPAPPRRVLARVAPTEGHARDLQAIVGVKEHQIVDSQRRPQLRKVTLARHGPIVQDGRVEARPAKHARVLHRRDASLSAAHHRAERLEHPGVQIAKALLVIQVGESPAVGAPSEAVSIQQTCSVPRCTPASARSRAYFSSR